MLPLQDHHALTCLQPFGLVMVCKIELLDVGWGSSGLPLGKNPASWFGSCPLHLVVEAAVGSPLSQIGATQLGCDVLLNIHFVLLKHSFKVKHRPQTLNLLTENYRLRAL